MFVQLFQHCGKLFSLKASAAQVIGLNVTDFFVKVIELRVCVYVSGGKCWLRMVETTRTSDSLVRVTMSSISVGLNLAWSFFAASMAAISSSSMKWIALCEASSFEKSIFW